MTRLSITALIAFIFLMMSPGVEAKPGADFRPDSGAGRRIVILFGASWCAPCIAELRAMGVLAAAVPSDRIVVAWMDTGIDRFPFERPANVEVVPLARAKELRKAHARGIAGYPYAVMLDAQGQVCARWRRGVTPKALDTMTRQCSRPPS